MSLNLLAMGLLLCAGCINGDRLLYEVEAEGEVVAPPPAAPVHLEFHHARRGGPGPLGHPLGLIAARSAPGPGTLRERLLVPVEEGEGLVVYGWMDRDGDGRLCAPKGPMEPAGLAAVAGFPAHRVQFLLVLSASCAGPEALQER